MNELVTIEQTKIADVFQAGGLDPYLEKIRAEVSELIPDVETDKGRKEIASMAHKVARSKTYLDGLGKTLVSGIKQQAKAIDAERKKMRDELDRIKADVRRPLDEYEQKEKERVEAIQKIIEWFVTISEAEYMESDAAKNALVRVKEFPIDDISAEFVAQAAKEKDKAMILLDAKVISLQKQEAEKAEAERIERERIEKERKEREERIAKEAAECARKEAKDAAKKEMERVERERQKLISTAKLAELGAKLAAERAEKEKLEAIKRERMRVERERKEAEEAELKRTADRNHRAEVNNAVMKALIAAGVPKTHAKTVVTVIAKKKVPHLRILY